MFCLVLAYLQNATLIPKATERLIKSAAHLTTEKC